MPVFSGRRAIPIVCIAGPTGAGKTAAALTIAAALHGSVINADSRQVYRDFPIITAQPTPEEQTQCPHLLYGYLPCGEKLGAGEYARAAMRAIQTENDSRRLPLLVGGTGLYFKTLLEGIAPVPSVPEEVSAHWQERCAREGAPALHALLAEKDPAYAAKIHPNDRQRVTRALEVWHATGKALSWWHAQPLDKPALAPCKIGVALSLGELEPLLAARIDLMLRAGALDEARRAMTVCNDAAAPGWSGIGCAEVYAHLAGKISFEECKSLWLKNTRAYAKRQLTWFRADKEIHWFRPNEAGAMLDHAAAWLAKTG